MRTAPLCLALVSAFAAAADTAQFNNGEDTGPHPKLVEPDKQLIPTVKVAEAVGWGANEQPTPAPGLAVTAFVRNLDHPRTVLVLPNGDVLVAETNAPPKPDDAKGVKGAVMKQVMKKAGAAPQSPNRIRLLRDENGDGVADTNTVFLANLNSPFGMALVGETLYIADSDALVKVPYHKGDKSISQTPEKVADLPAGTINHHWTKSLVASADGKHLYVGVGSNSNAAENGMAAETNRAAILEVDPATGKWTTWASGLRNPTALALQPQSTVLWAVVNERDELGNDLVPDYLTSVRQGAFYGWPYSYYGQHVDERVKPPNPEMVAKAIAPDYALGSHVAALGLAFNTAKCWPDSLREGAFVSLHGSWNRKPLNGYKVVFVPFQDAKASGRMVDVLTGFVDAQERAHGRPVGVAIDATGGLLVVDDVGNAVWRVAPKNP